jgi:hypothetical protein
MQAPVFGQVSRLLHQVHLTRAYEILSGVALAMTQRLVCGPIPEVFVYSHDHAVESACYCYISTSAKTNLYE